MASADPALTAALSQLSPADRALLELSLGHGLPDGEVADLVAVPPEDLRARREELLGRLATDVGSDTEAGARRLRKLLGGPRRPEGRRERIVSAARSAPGVALLLLPGAFTAYLGFHAGGFFPRGTAAVAVLICLVILLRATLADRPFAGLSPLAVVAVTLFSGFALWTWLSGTWSDAPARALIEFDRALLYLVTLVLFVSLPRSTRRLQIMLWGLAGAAVAVCLVALTSRVLPDLLPTARNVANERLAYPVTYWNALGMLASLGILACFHIAASVREPRPARVLGAAAVPLLAVTLFFTFSRGAIAVVVVALVVYVALARPRGALTAFLAIAPPTVVAVVVAYGADRLSAEDPTASAAATQANRVAAVTAIAVVVAAVLRFVLLRLDERLSSVQIPAGRRRLVLVSLTASLVVAIAGTSLALDAPRAFERQYDRFLEGKIKQKGDPRARLTNTANNGRLDHWRVALDAYRSDPVKGQGAGTYELAWARDRPFQFVVLDGHSLYLETLGELGIVGLLLLIGGLLILAGGLATRIRGPDRALYAAIFAMALAWIIRAGLDWDWEMPVITLWLFALGGAALARPVDARQLLGPPPRLARIAIGLVALALALTPALIYLSEGHIRSSTRSFDRGNCVAAVDEALAATSVLSVRPEPFEILGYCDIRLGRPQLAIRAMEEAVERDPDAWQLHYGLALVRASAGRDPRPQARAALRLNPLGPLPQDAVKRFRTDDPQKWRRRARSARLPVH